MAGHEGVESVEIDFRALLTRVKAANADLVFGGFAIDSGGPQIIQQMKALGLFDAGAKFMGPDGFYSPALVEQATPTAVNNNVYVTFAGLPPDQLPTDLGKRFYTEYKAKYKDEPIGWAMYAYQATIVTVDAINRAGAKIEPRSWKRYTTPRTSRVSPAVSASTTMVTRTAPIWVGFRSKIIGSSSSG